MRTAVSTLTFVYADQTAVLGALSTYAEPHAYDLCVQHAERLSVPRGWEVIRLATNTQPVGPTTDDLLALADAVREAARPAPVQAAVHEVDGNWDGDWDRAPQRETGRETGRRGHLRMLTSD